MARKTRYLKFGTADYPIPVLRGDKIAWLASDEDAILLPTMREENEDFIYGMLIRNCVPDTAMLPIMEEMLIRLDPVRTNPKIKSYNYQIIGTPGGGKTYIMKQVGKLVHPKGAFIEECKTIQNPEQIYKVTLLNVEQANKQSAIDAKILLGNMDPAEAMAQNTILYMKSKLGNKVITQEVRDGNRITSIDWRAINKPSDLVDVVLTKVCEMEKIPVKDNTNNLGFKVRNGTLLDALVNKEHPDFGRIVILDESNRMPELYNISAFFSEPGDDKITLKGEDDRDFTIYREDIPDTFMLYETGNKAIEGMGDDVQVASKPALSRKGAGIDVQTIPIPDRNDYIARIAKHMTGLPAMQIYLSEQDFFDENPDELRNTLMYMRTVGLTKDQIARIPRGELYNIENFHKVIRVCTSYGEILHQADKLISEVVIDESKHKVPDSYREYLRNEALVDLRYAYKLLQHSETARPKAQTDVSDILKGLGKRRKANAIVNIEDEKSGEAAYVSLLHRGTNLENEVASKLKEMFIPKDAQRFIDSADNATEAKNSIETIWSNIVHSAKQLNFQFAGYEGSDSVAQSYNIKEEELPEIEAMKVKKVLLDSLQEHFKDVLGDDGITESILSKEQIIEALTLIKQSGTQPTTGNGVFLTAPNLDVDTVSTNPLKHVLMLANHDHAHIPAEHLITTNQFADTFIINDVRNMNLRQYWLEEPKIDMEDKNISDTTKEIAFGKHSEVATTSVFVNDNGKTGTAHIIHNKVSNNTMIISNFNVSPSDAKSLNNSGVLFVNIAKGDIEYNIKKVSVGMDGILHKTKSGVKEDDIIAAVMVRVDPYMAESGQEVKDLCQYLKGMNEIEELPQKAAHITNVSSKSEIPQAMTVALQQQSTRR